MRDRLGWLVEGERGRREKGKGKLRFLFFLDRSNVWRISRSLVQAFKHFMTQIIYGCWFPSSSYKNAGSCSLKWPKEDCKTLASETTLFLVTFSPSSCKWLLIRWRPHRNPVTSWPWVPEEWLHATRSGRGLLPVTLKSPPAFHLIYCYSVLKYNELSEDEEPVWVTSSQHTPNTQEAFRSSQIIGYKDERSLSFRQNCCVSLRGCLFCKHFQGCMLFRGWPIMENKDPQGLRAFYLVHWDCQLLPGAHYLKE